MIRPLTILVLLISLLLPQSCAEDRWPDYAALERDLLIVWVALEKEDRPVMREYTAAATLSWRKLRSELAETGLGTEEKVALKLMDLWLLGLRNAVDNDQIREVRSQLRHLHNQLRGLRPDYGVDHPVDLLYGFDAQWKWVEEISHDQMVQLLEWNEYEDAFDRADENWVKFKNQSPAYAQRTLPGLTGNSGMSELSGTRLTAALADFEQLLREANHEGMGRESERVRARFIDYLAVAVGYPAIPTPL